MASIFKLGKDKRDKKASYHFEYADEHGRRRRRKGFTDKSLTAQLAAKIEHQVLLRKQGLIDPELEKAAEHRRLPILTHLADFEKALKSKGSIPRHVRKVVNRVKRIIEEGNMKTLSDLDIELVQQVLLDIQESDDLGARTYNHYVQAIDQFCRWLVPKRLLRNPVAGLARLNAEADIRHKRRALSDQEVQQLIQSAEKSDIEVQGYPGELRAKLYFLAYMTGLRRRELASLTTHSFNFTSNPPTLTVQAACSKHRKEDTLPLHPELVTFLLAWLPELKPGEYLFPELEEKRTYLMVRKDLEKAGIPYQTDEGIADFHAAGRHSYVTGLLRSGASLPQAKELARHGDVRMTMRYTHIGLQDQAAALNSLPVPRPVSKLVSNRDVTRCPSSSAAVTDLHAAETASSSENETSDSDGDHLSSDDTDQQKRRGQDAV